MINRRYLNAWMAAIAFLIGGVTPGQGQAENPYLPNSSFDLGTVRQGAVVEHRFTVQNLQQSPATVRIVGLSHPGMKVRMPQALEPGAIGSITLTWDTRFVQGDTTVEALLRFNDNLTGLVTLSAKVIPPVDILPYPAVFLSGFRGESVTRTLEVVNNDLPPLNIVSVSSENEDIARSYSTTFRALEPGRRHEVKIELSSAAPVGRLQDILMVLTDNARFPVIRIPVNLLVKDDVYVNPESVDFGQITAASGPETFLLKTRRGPINIVSVTSDLPYLRVTHTDSDAASTHRFRVELESFDLKPGPFLGNIFIKTDDPSFPELKVPVHGEIRR